jgi:hypothetical protein
MYVLLVLIQIVIIVMLPINVLAVLQDILYLIMLVWLVLYRIVLLVKLLINVLLVMLVSTQAAEPAQHALILTAIYVLLPTNAQAV